MRKSLIVKLNQARMEERGGVGEQSKKSTFCSSITIRWLFIAIIAFAFFCCTAFALCVKEKSVSASAADVGVTYNEANSVFTPFSEGGATTAYNDFSKEGGDERGVKLVSTETLTEFQTPFLTTGNSYFEFYLQDYTSAEDYATVGRREMIFNYIALNAQGGQDARYQIYLYQVYDGTQHLARYAVFHQDEAYNTQTIVADVNLPFLFDVAVNQQIKISLSFQPIEKKIVISAEGYDDTVCDLSVTPNFNPYMYYTRVHLKGTVVLSKFINYSLQNVYDDINALRQFTMPLGNASYVSDTGEGILPTTVKEGMEISIHKTKLCFAFFVGSAETGGLTYTVSLYKGDTSLQFTDDGDYYRYVFTSGGEYRVVINVETVLGHTLEKTYTITCGSMSASVDTLFSNSKTEEGGIRGGNGNVADNSFAWMTTGQVLQGKTTIYFRAVQLPDYAEGTVSKTFNIILGNAESKILTQINLISTNRQMQAYINVIQDYEKTNAVTSENVDTNIAFNEYTDFFFTYDPFQRTLSLGTVNKSQFPSNIELGSDYSLPTYAYGLTLGVNSGDILITALNDFSLKNEDGKIETVENSFCLDTLSVAYKPGETLLFNKEYFTYNYLFEIVEKSASLKNAQGTVCSLQTVGGDYSYTFTEVGEYVLSLSGKNSFGTTTTIEFPIKVLPEDAVASREFSATIDKDSVWEKLYTKNGTKFYVEYVDETNTIVYLPKLEVKDSCGLSYDIDVSVNSVALSSPVEVLLDEDGQSYFLAELLGSYNVTYKVNSDYGGETANVVLSIVAVNEFPTESVDDTIKEKDKIKKIDLYLIIVAVECLLIGGCIVCAKIRKKKKGGE